ncbi:MAG: hypothetical protein HGB11_15665 [Chlorobiales bacterium]|nr:hypothetical protein [Chlorobiales bacterium]
MKEKEYWIQALKEGIDKRIATSVTSDVDELFAFAKKEAEKRFILKAGLYDELVEMDDINAELKSLDERKQELNDRVNSISRLVLQAVKQKHPDAWHYYYKDALEAIGEQTYRVVLREMVPAVADLIDLKDSLERKIMLANTSTNLQKFLEAFCKKNK